MTHEKWRSIKDYEGFYEISSLGRIKSLHFGKEKILKQAPDSTGYLMCRISKDGIPVNKKIHILMAIIFLGHIPNKHEFVVDHINGIKTDNRLENLQIVTHRENSSICYRKNRPNFSSKFTGVYWNKVAKKWMTQMRINGKLKTLGTFSSEIDAANIYTNTLNKLKENV